MGCGGHSFRHTDSKYNVFHLCRDSGVPKTQQYPRLTVAVVDY